MSVLTVSGALPDPTNAFEYSINPGLSSDPVLRATASGTSYIHPQKTSYTVTTHEIKSDRPPNVHRHSRTVSSGVLPADFFHTAPSKPNTKPAPTKPHPMHSRQSSTATSTNTMGMQRQGTSASTISAPPRRSTSSRSTTTNSPTSYVALMRKQKATVWCDRSQSLDPRVAAAEKAARQRAILEVQGSVHSGAGRTSTISSGGVVGKIRHGGVPKAPGYVPANMSGAGVPMRLSANEMLGDEDEGRGRITGDNSMTHGRTGSGKSSTHSAYRSGYPRADQGRFSSNSTPPSGGETGGSPGNRNPIPEHADEQSEYFLAREKAHSADEDSFGELKDMSGPSAAQQAMAQAKTSEDLRRRGSVDERAATMGSNVKLFVANPDLDDD